MSDKNDAVRFFAAAAECRLSAIAEGATLAKTKPSTRSARASQHEQHN